MTVGAYLSQNFSVLEIFGEHAPTEAERFLAERLCAEVLEVVRGVVGMPLHITDGYRTWEQFQELQRRGYKPYRYSDHSYLQAWSPFGVGAADVLKIRTTRARHKAREPFTEEEYLACVDALPQECYGQVIWYRRRGHMHLSNPRSVWFTEAAQRYGGFPAYHARTYIKEG